MKRTEVRPGMRVKIVKAKGWLEPAIGRTGTVLPVSHDRKLLIYIQLDEPVTQTVRGELPFFPGEIEPLDPVEYLAKLAEEAAR